MALLGKDPNASIENQGNELVAQEHSDSEFEENEDSDMASDGDDRGMEVDDGRGADSELSDSSDSEDSDDEDRRRGMDKLQATHGIDIPIAQNIPIVSTLAKEENKQDKSTQKEANKKRITEFIE